LTMFSFIGYAVIGACLLQRDRYEVGARNVPERAEPGEVYSCTANWDPVCGVDGRTYSNACYAWLSQVDVAHEGSCRASARRAKREQDSSPCELSSEQEQVCGVDGVTYSNESVARCLGHTQVAHSGECEPCVCTANFDPVCSNEGLTYPNGCIARCSGVNQFTAGPCVRPESA